MPPNAMRRTMGTARSRVNRLAIVTKSQRAPGGATYASLLVHPYVTVRLAPPLIDERGNQAGPSGLMRRSESCPVFAVVELIKQNEIPPVRALLEFTGSAVYRAAAVAVAREDANHAVCDIGSNCG